MFFNGQYLPTPANEYVAWIDVMGTQAAMSRSIQATANFVFKLHIAALEASAASVTLYPVMDGLYASSPSQADFLAFVSDVFHRVASEFVNEPTMQHRFMIRGGMSFGPVFHGRHINHQASPVLANHPEYRAAILLGMPMVQAHLVERDAPPFGLYVHESARTFSPTNASPLHVAWFKWLSGQTGPTWNALIPAMADYFSWCRARSQAIAYPVARIDAHAEMFRQLVA